MRKITLLLGMLISFNLHSYAQSPEIGKIKSSIKNIKDSFEYVDALNRIAMLMYEKNVDSTFYYTRMAREVANRKNYSKGKADALNNLGIFFDIKGNPQLSLRYYNEAYSEYTKIKDESNRVQLMMNIAGVYNEIGKDQRSIKWFDEAISAGNKLSKDSIMSLVIYNYLLAYPDKFTSGRRHDYINRAKEIALKYKDERVLLAIDQLIADDFIAQNERKKGLALLAKTINSAIDKKLYFVSMDMHIDMGDQLIQTDPLLAIVQYKKGLAIADENGYLFYRQILTKKIFFFYVEHGDNATAVVYSKQLLELQEEQSKIDNSSSIDYLDYARKEQEVNALMLRSRYQVILLILITIACSLAIGILLVIRRNLKRTRILNEQVVNQNNLMKETLAALGQSQADNTRMLKIVAHDLRSPIAGIHALTSLMIDGGNRSKEELQMLNVIKDSSKDSLKLVNDLLQVQFKTEALNKAPFDLADMLRHCVLLLKSTAEAKAQQINMKVKQVIILASREKLWRVINNLIANAIKFSPNGTKISVEMEQSATHVKIAITDEGIGIPMGINDEIFDTFTNAKRVGTAGEEPFGMGLAISKQIVEAHQGKIWFERQQNNGTTFFVKLPFITY